MALPSQTDLTLRALEIHGQEVDGDTMAVAVRSFRRLFSGGARGFRARYRAFYRRWAKGGLKERDRIFAFDVRRFASEGAIEGSDGDPEVILDLIGGVDKYGIPSTAEELGFDLHDE